MTSTRFVLAIWLLLSVLLVPVFPHFLSPNELSRWAVAAAVVESGTVEVSALMPILGSRLEDLSEVDGRIYSNKAPGGVLVALPGYVAGRIVAGPPSATSLRPVLYMMRWAGATLPLLLLAVGMVRLARRYGASEDAAAFLLLALLFGTICFTYGLLLFSHALVAASLFVAWALLFGAREDGQGIRRDYFAGAMIGIAVLSEYPAAVPAAVLVAGSISRRDPARLMRILLGGGPFALCLALYNSAAFGGPFQLSSGFERAGEFRELAGSGFFGIGLPSPAILLRLLLDPSKGLLIFSPILLLAPAGWKQSRAAMGDRAFFTLLAVPLSILLLYAGYPNWHGGWTVGPRYLVAALPFLCFPLVFVWRGKLAALLTGYSVSAVVVTTLAFPFVPPAFPFPWGSFASPILRDGLVMPNALHFVSSELAVIVPLLLAMAALAAPFRTRQVAFVGMGVLLAMAIGCLAERHVERSIGVRIQRGYIREVYFLDRGALQQSAGPGMPLPSRLVDRLRYESTLPPVAWPFEE